MKNKIINLIIIILINLSTHSNAQNWQWAQQYGGPSTDFSAIVQSKNGSIYATGGFYGSYLQCNNFVTNACQGINDFFVTKLDFNGNVKWLRQCGGLNLGTNNYEGIGGTVIDSLENIYVTGGYYFNTKLGQFNLSGIGFETFIAKFDSSGNCIWAKSAGGLGKDGAYGICLSDNNEITITGTNDDSITFDNFTLPPGGFIARYDSIGNFLYAKKIFEPFNYLNKKYSCANPSDIKYFDGKLLISGSVANDTLQSDTISSFLKVNSHNDFVACYDFYGNIYWIRTFAGPLPYTAGFSLGIDNFGSTFVAGTFTDTGYFQTDTLFNNGLKDAFLVKYNLYGIEQWVRQLNATGGSICNNVSTDSYGYSYITGEFSGNAQFGGFTQTANSPYDFFVARYDSNGNCLGFKTFENGRGNGVTQDNLGNVIIAATFTQSTALGAFSFNASGVEDVLYAKCDAITGTMENKPPINQLLIYANPTQGKCNITIPDDMANEAQLTLTVYDNMGRVIQERTVYLTDSKIKLNLSAEAKGMYHVALSSGTKRYTGKIIFE